MTFEQYDAETGKTMMPTSNNIEYLTLGLVSEAGEVAGKVKKIIRDKGGVIIDADKLELLKEISDCCWYVSRLSAFLGSSTEKVCEINFLKLKSRAERGTISGSGDNR